MFCGKITEEENKNLPQALQPDVIANFHIFRLGKIILKNSFVFREWMYQKEMLTMMIFSRLQEQQK